MNKLNIDKVLEIIESMIVKQQQEHDECALMRKGIMKTQDKINWGMSKASDRIEHYIEVKEELKKCLEINNKKKEGEK